MKDSIVPCWVRFEDRTCQDVQDWIMEKVQWETKVAQVIHSFISPHRPRKIPTEKKGQYGQRPCAKVEGRRSCPCNVEICWRQPQVRGPSEDKAGRI